MSRSRQGRAAAAIVALALTLGAACTEETAPVPPPEDVETCDELVDVSVQLVDVWIDVLGELPVEQLMADEPPPEFVELAAIGADVDARAGRLGCDAAAMNAAVAAALEERQLDAGADPVIALLLDIIRGGVVGELPPPPATTTTAGTS